MRVVITNPHIRVDPLLGRELLSLAEVVTVEDSSRAALERAVADADALLVAVEQIDAELIASMHRCRLIQRSGIGIDMVDVAAATRAGIQVCNVPDANHLEVATHAVAMIFSLARRLPQWDAAIKAGGFAQNQLGMSLRRPAAQRVGLLGLGRIGRQVARVLAAAQFELVGYDPFVGPEEAAALGVQWLPQDAVIASSNVLSLHLPLTAENHHVIDAAAIGTMPQGAVVVNVSRGGLIDEEALADALATGRLGGAGIDTFETEPLSPSSRLRTLEGVLLSPHAAHFSLEAVQEIRVKSYAEIVRALLGHAPLHPVNTLGSSLSGTRAT